MARRPNGSHWTKPSSPLQAARFQRRIFGQQVVDAIRDICPGHGGRSCRLDTSKFSEYETGAARPGITHIEALCRYYQRGPEELGLISWRGTPPETGTETETPEIASSSAPPPHDPIDTGRASDNRDRPPRLVVIWVRERLDPEAAALASAVLQTLSQDSAGESHEPPP